jgi:hypothetical protein
MGVLPATPRAGGGRRSPAPEKASQGIPGLRWLVGGRRPAQFRPGPGKRPA